MNFWENKKVLVTGHTGFKGSWLALWLQYLGADVYGYSNTPSVSDPNLYKLASVAENMDSVYGDMLDYEQLQSFIHKVQPEFIFHLAAQPLVRESYRKPIETFSINVMGTAHLLEVARHTESVRVVINVTTDKCYENNNSLQGFIESDPVGGTDPYSASKACSEIITSAYKRSFYSNGRKLLSSARAGNVIGGGDWAADRIIPDIIRSILHKQKLNIRYPSAIRPWQHVLDCLNGYLLLAQNMGESGEKYVGSWNFGPGEASNISVAQLIEECNKHLDYPVDVLYPSLTQPYEASTLVLNSEKASRMLNWRIELPINHSIEWTMDWYLNYMSKGIQDLTLKQIRDYEKIKSEKHTL
ncbi:CDP-glucose 4,6-dehydratase [Paenibacillus sp. FSL P2-0136]|uniref:CDP-glucose 4,6-dehydratase n=1 Tax=unclassified Paenibacillus TaxID=185978 RepID=UPI0030DBBE2A